MEIDFTSNMYRNKEDLSSLGQVLVKRRFWLQCQSMVDPRHLKRIKIQNEN